MRHCSECTTRVKASDNSFLARMNHGRNAVLPELGTLSGAFWLLTSGLWPRQYFLWHMTVTLCCSFVTCSWGVKIESVSSVLSTIYEILISLKKSFHLNKLEWILFFVNYRPWSILNTSLKSILLKMKI